jgi:hypothetical protein
MATAARPSSRRREEEYEEPPARKRQRDDFDDDDRPLRRGPRRDAHETESSGTLPLVLGIISIVFSVMAIPLAFMGCCPPLAFIAAGLAVLGLLLGGGGLVAAFVQKRGMPCPIIGCVLSVIALAIVLAWGLVWGGFYMEGKKQAAQQQKLFEDLKKQTDESKLRETSKEKGKDKEYNPKDPQAGQWRKQSHNNLKQLALAMQVYHDKYKSFPAQKGTAPPLIGKGPPKTNNMSWRVAILPFIEQHELYNKFKHNEAWDSPHNKKVLDENPMPAVFASPLAEDGTKLTYYQIIVGEKTPWPNDTARPRIPGSFTDGTSNTFLIVEGKTAVYWTKPEDITFDGKDVPPLGGIFAGEFNAAAVDGSVGWYSNKFRPDQIIARITATGGEQINQFPD